MTSIKHKIIAFALKTCLATAIFLTAIMVLKK